MTESENLKKWLVVGTIITISIIALSSAVILNAYLINSSGDIFSGNSHTGGHRVSYPLNFTVEESLKPYLTINCTGESGYSNGTIARMFLNGTVSWIGSSQESVKSLSNIHLVMYTRVDDRQYVNGELFHTYVGIHLEAFLNEPLLPNDTIDHTEVLIPKIGIDSPTFRYNLNCSTFING